MKSVTLFVFALLIVAAICRPEKIDLKQLKAEAAQKKACMSDCANAKFDPICAGKQGVKSKSFGSECILKNYNCEHHEVLYSILGLIIVTGGVCLVMRRRKNKRALEMRTPSSTEPPIQMAVIATSDGQTTATYAVPRPRAVRLDIPATNIV